VYNRGVARRTLFEGRRDARFFLACLAREIRAGNLEVHAYCLMTTHFHLFVRSPRGRLSAAMQRVQVAYARWFNRGRGRDGPLFRGRFRNRIVETEAYALTLLRYIDRNPVEARLVAAPGEYPWGSARHYLRAKGPPWLSRGSVQGTLSGRDDLPWDPAHYERFLAEETTAGERWIARRRFEAAPAPGPDPLDELLQAAPERVRRWMDRRAGLADGTRTGVPVVSPGTLQAVLRGRARQKPGRTLAVGARAWAFWEVAEAGALREFSGLRFRELEGRMRLSRGVVQERLRTHARARSLDEDYRAALAEVLREALARDFPGRTGHRPGPRVLGVPAPGGAEGPSVVAGAAAVASSP
jgi:REP element-mobilizing transposase RayT